MLASYSLSHDVWQVYMCTVKACSPTKKQEGPPPLPAPRLPRLTCPFVSLAHSRGPVRVNSDILGQRKCGESIQRWVETAATKKSPNTFMIKIMKTAKWLPPLIRKTTGLVIQTRDILTHPGEPHSGFGKSALFWQSCYKDFLWIASPECGNIPITCIVLHYYYLWL